MTRSETDPFTNGLEPFTNTDGVSMLEKPRSKSKSRPNMRCQMPKGLQYRLEHIIVAERRLSSVVYDKIVEDFLATLEFEPRPYIPVELVHEDTVSHNYSIAPELSQKLRERAEFEGRSVQTLFIRAVHDYVRNSPDDPMKVELKLEPSSELEPKIKGDLR